MHSRQLFFRHCRAHKLLDRNGLAAVAPEVDAAKPSSGQEFVLCDFGCINLKHVQSLARGRAEWNLNNLDVVKGKYTWCSTMKVAKG